MKGHSTEELQLYWMFRNHN